MFILLCTSLAFAGDFSIANHKVVHQELPNGLDVLWIDDGKSTIDIYNVYAVGSHMDTKPDLAHMTEHAMFCTNDGAYDALVKKYAEASNAYTRSEHTTYYTTGIEPENLTKVLDYEYRRMASLEVTQECFDYEKGRLEKEVEDNHSLVHEWDRDLSKAIFGSGYGGYPAEQVLDISDIKDFYQQWYQPNRASLVFIGAMGQENWNAIINRFKNLQNRSKPQFSIAPLQPASTTLDYPFGLERVSWLWRGPTIADPESWLYWSLLAKAYLLDRNDGQLEVFMNAGFMVSVIEFRATGPEPTERLKNLQAQINSGQIDKKRFSDAKGTFAKSIQDLALRTRPYFSLASELGYWASWDQLSTLHTLMDRAQTVSSAPSRQALSFIKRDAKVEVKNPKKEIGDIPTDPKELSSMAQIAMESGDILRAIICYEKLLDSNPGKINLVIYHYYLGNLYLEIGDKQKAKKYLLDGLAIVEYPALRQLLEEIDSAPPQQRGEAQKFAAASDRLSFDGDVPEWAAQAAEVMEQIEKWRGLKFKNKVTIRFQDTGDNIAGWYDHVTKELVVGDGRSKRFSKGVMLHELYHALQDQHFDLTRMEEMLNNPDGLKAFRAVVEGEAMMAVSEMMDYDFLSHVRYGPEMTDGQFHKFFDYGEGMKFVKAIRDAEGWDGVSKLYQEPPLSTRAILVPKRYLSGFNAPQSLPHAVKRKRHETVLGIESKGAYGWMRFLVQQASSNRLRLVEMYEEDQYVTLSSNGQAQTRWRIGFANAKAAKNAKSLLQEDNIFFVRTGRWLETEIK